MFECSLTVNPLSALYTILPKSYEQPRRLYKNSFKLKFKSFTMNSNVNKLKETKKMKIYYFENNAKPPTNPHVNPQTGSTIFVSSPVVPYKNSGGTHCTKMES